MPLSALRPYLLALAMAAAPALLAGKLPLTNAKIPWSVMMEMGYPDPALDTRRAIPQLASAFLRAGNATPKEAQELLKSGLAGRLSDQLTVIHLRQCEVFREQVDLLNESFALGEVEDGSEGAARRAGIEARLEELETDLAQSLRRELESSEKLVAQLRGVKDAMQLGLASAGSTQGRTRAAGNLRAAEHRLGLAQQILTLVAETVVEAPWQDWRDGFGFKALPEGLVLCLPGSWHPSMADGAKITGCLPRSRPGEPDSLIRLRMLRGIREQGDLVAFGLAEIDARRQREADEAARANSEQAKLEAEAEARRNELRALEAERKARRSASAQLRAQDRESKLEALTQSVRDLENDASWQKQAAEAEEREWTSALDRKEQSAEEKRQLRRTARTASPWSEAPSEPAAACSSSSSSSEPLPVDWHDEARIYDLNKQVKDSTTRDFIETAVGMLRTGRLMGTAVAGAPGIFELRPCGGQSTWRPLYVRHGERFVIVALAREAMANPAKFAAGIKRAQRRAAALPPPPA